jgi:DNA-binding NtrC family response regulator
VKNEIKIQPAQEVPRGKERILLVDDEIELVESGIRVLKRMGYQMEGATDPIKALETIRNQPHQFDLIICDFSMPRMTGIQLAEEIKRINPGIPIILLSGYSSEMTTGQTKTFAVSDFIIKPVNKNDLARVIRKVLDDPMARGPSTN